MNESPNMADILGAVANWLEAGGEGAGGFHGKVAANALRIAEREQALAGEFERSAIARLTALTGKEGSFADLERLVCDLIRAGELAPDDPMLLDHLAETARARLAIDQPKYRSLLG